MTHRILKKVQKHLLKKAFLNNLILLLSAREKDLNNFKSTLFQLSFQHLNQQEKQNLNAKYLQ